MRVGPVIGGAVVLSLVILFPFLFFVLVPLGVILLILGLALPPPASVPHEELLTLGRQVTWLGSAVADLNARLGRLEGLPPEAPIAPVTQPTAQPVTAPPPAIAAPAAPLPTPGPPPPVPATFPAPSPSRIGAPRPEVSRLEFELGEKWFQRIGILVLAIAFAFVLAIALPRMTPQQIIASIFAAAVALAVLGEAIYRWKGLVTYAKGLEIGAFGLAHIGAWGVGFAFNFVDITGLEITIAAAVLLNFGAAFRYKSPFLAVQAGLLYLGWVTWLRYTGEVESLAASALIALAALGVVFLLEVQRHIPATMALFVAQGAAVGISLAALGASAAPALTSLVAVAWAIAARTRISSRLTSAPEVIWASWAIALVLPLTILSAYAEFDAIGIPTPTDFNGIPRTDVVVLSLLGVNLATWTWIELRAGGSRALAFFVLLTGAALPIVGLLTLGIVAAGLLLAVYGALGWKRPTRGLAWGANLSYAAVVIYQAGQLSHRGAGAAYLAVALFGATAIVHALHQRRSGYGTKNFPTDLQVVAFALVIAGLAAVDLAAAVPSIAIFYGVLASAIAVNRGAVSTPGRASAVAFAGVAALVAARSWVLRGVLDPLPESDPARHLFAVLGVLAVAAGAMWIAWRRLVVALPKLPQSVRFAPALAALAFAVLAQETATTPWFAVVPVALAAASLMLADPLTFNVAAPLGIAQGFIILVSKITISREALPAIAVGAAIWFALGVVLREAPGRREIAGPTLVASTIAIVVAVPFAYGLGIQSTAGWALAGFAAVGYGLWRRVRALRYVGFTAFFAVIGKALLYDIAGLALELRVVGLIIVSVSLLLISYGYARLRKRQAVGKEALFPPGPR